MTPTSIASEKSIKNLSMHRYFANAGSSPTDSVNAHAFCSNVLSADCPASIGGMIFVDVDGRFSCIGGAWLEC